MNLSLNPKANAHPATQAGRGRMRRIGALLLCLLLGMAQTALGEYIGEMTVVNCSEWVSLRAQPDDDARRLLKVPLGAVVKNCSQHSEAYVYAEYEGRCGFIMSRYLAPVGGAALALGDLQVANCSDWVNMRAEPGLEARRLAKVPLGAVVEDCTAAANGFVHGWYKGQAGYIHGAYLAAADGSPGEKRLTDCRVRLTDMERTLGAVLITAELDAGDTLDAGTLAQALGTLEEAWQALAASVPKTRIVGIPGGRELYLIIPQDGAAVLSVNQTAPGTPDSPGGFVRLAYHARSGEPILLRCGADGMDAEVNLTTAGGSGLTWRPCVDAQTGTMVTDAVGGPVCDLTEAF